MYSLEFEKRVFLHFTCSRAQKEETISRILCHSIHKTCSTNDENIEPIVIDDKEDEDDDVVFVEVVNRNAEKR